MYQLICQLICFTNIISTNPHENSMVSIVIMQEGIWDLEKSKDFRGLKPGLKAVSALLEISKPALPNHVILIF